MSKLTRRGALIAGAGAAAACAQEIETPPYDGEVAFHHGVASGDPRADRVVIWTRVSPEQDGPVPVRWIVARNRELTDVVKTGVAQTNAGRDYTVKVDVTGLRPGAPYFYGFRAGAAQSPAGKTRTLPRRGVAQARIAVVSCASYPHGFFNVYEAVAQRDDVDLVVHLGDYIYEYGLSGYGGEQGLALGRVPSPEVECVTLEDYRRRHAQYKAEGELQRAHAAAPWVVVWDDHETANDSWSGGAENHQQPEGEWRVRKSAAMQAYYEWMPIRDPEPGRAFETINRSFQFGDLFSLIMLETRLLARTQPLDYARDMPVQMQRWNIANPDAPVALRPHEADTAQMRMLPALYEAVGDELRPVYDWRRAQVLLLDPYDLPDGFFLAPDAEQIETLLASPERVMLGQAQQDWLTGELAASRQGGVAWRLLGNQVMMAPLTAPDLSETPLALAQALERLRPGVTRLLKLTRFPFPLNTDAWDGYPASRARVLDAIRAAGGGALVLTGDTHSAWANEIEDEEGLAAIELGTTSVTSPSDASFFTAAGIDFAAGVRARNPHVKWADMAHRGFLLLTLTPDAAQAEFFTVSSVEAREFELDRAAAFSIDAATGALTQL